VAKNCSLKLLYKGFLKGFILYRMYIYENILLKQNPMTEI